jgi:hypothetical protein
MKILIWHSKGGDVYWDASTPEKESAAYLAMFKEMNDQGDYECCPPENGQEPYYEKAKAGDAAAAKKFLTIRSGRDYEYEGLSIQPVQDPLGVKA